MNIVYWVMFGVVAFVLLFLVPLAYFKELRDERDRWLRMPGAISTDKATQRREHLRAMTRESQKWPGGYR